MVSEINIRLTTSKSSKRPQNVEAVEAKTFHQWLIKSQKRALHLLFGSKPGARYS